MTVWGKDPASLEAALSQLADAVEYADAPPAKRALVLKEIESTTPPGLWPDSKASC
jgi:hypothetical protein